MADCRKCFNFVPLYEIRASGDYDLMERLLIEGARVGKEVLGYCRVRDAPVYYYKGRCRFYIPRSSEPPAKKPITYYLERMGEKK